MSDKVADEKQAHEEPIEDVVEPREIPLGKRVLLIFAHPDDMEFGCGGTAARWADEGCEICLCVVTDGSSGSDDPGMTPEKLAETRKSEQLAANKILGISHLVNLDRPDGMVVPDLDLRRDLVRVIRQFQTEVIVCQDPSVYFYGNQYINHPDHRAVATAAIEALFPAAGNRNYFPELLEEGLEPIKIQEVYISNSREPDVWVDTSSTIDRKIEALRQHKSQMGDWDPGPMLRKWSAEDGAKRTPPVDYAEDFRYMKIEG
ncbi:MAG: PIG-L family deacetylase [Thermomicrobiales bacterium]|nr:PIG-L family deacetylase [Thermomicrobiales bacterium]MCO5220569.1 PIG-L family deacetylase [Thermomicrobiales bacterium]